MSDTDKFLAVLGAYVLGAVYLGGMIAVGLAWDSSLVVFLGLASAGTGYLCQIASVMVPRGIAMTLWALSLCCAAGAAGALLV